MATNPQAAQLPPLYNALAPLSSSVHQTLGLKSRTGAPFARGLHAIPITVDEFHLVQRHYPIVFAAGQTPVPLALTSLSEGQNLFVDEDGNWRAGTYVPAYVRRYPFLLARINPQSEELTLCFDETSEDLGADEGEPLFKEGEATDVVKNVLEFCEQFENSMRKTQAFVQELEKGEFLMDGEVSIQMDGMEQPAVYRGFKMISQDKIRDLRGDQARKLIQNGMLPLMYAHLFSLSYVTDLFSQGAAKATAEKADA